MSQQTQSKREHDQRIIEIVERAQANGETDIGGGVPLDTILEDETLPLSETTIRDYARALVAEGRLEYQWGLPQDRNSYPRCGFVLPAEASDE